MKIFDYNILKNKIYISEIYQKKGLINCALGHNIDQASGQLLSDVKYIYIY
jgi:hypothetical protein